MVRVLNLQRIQIDGAHKYDVENRSSEYRRRQSGYSVYFPGNQNSSLLSENMTEPMGRGSLFKDRKVINIYENVIVYDYAYKAFHKLRDADGITSEMIRVSLDPQANLENAKKAGESTGRSGSFFFFSQDRKFIIKTMFENELEIFMLKLNDYFEHLENHQDSIIARIYGIF